jgi:hypothetical protein
MSTVPVTRAGQLLSSRVHLTFDELFDLDSALFCALEHAKEMRKLVDSDFSRESCDREIAAYEALRKKVKDARDAAMISTAVAS